MLEAIVAAALAAFIFLIMLLVTLPFLPFIIAGYFLWLAVPPPPDSVAG